jgi:hypothetical protein
MRATRLLAPVLATVALIAVLAAVPGGAQGQRIPNIPLPKATSIKVTIDIAGYLDITHDYDSTGNCSPGKAYTVQEEFDFETSRPVSARLTRLTIPGRGTMTTASVSRPVGRATTSGEVSGWRTTNTCSGPRSPEPDPPECRTARGRMTFELTPASRLPGEDDELTPLQGRTLMLNVTRRGGGNQNRSCYEARPGLLGTVGQDYGDTLVEPNVNDRQTGLVLSTGIDSIKAMALRRGKSIRRTIRLTGPCDAVRISSRNAGARPSAKDSCFVKGSVFIAVKRSR